MKLSPLTRRRLANFRANGRGFWSLWIFLLLFLVSLFAELIANDRPLLVRHDGRFYVPVLVSYPETTFGGVFPTEAVYRDPAVQQMIRDKGGWMLWPPVPFRYDTINYDLPVPAPAPPSSVNWLGTDDQGRDLLARRVQIGDGDQFGVGLLVEDAGMARAEQTGADDGDAKGCHGSPWCVQVRLDLAGL